MRKLLSISFAVCLFVSAGSVRADDQADLQALLDKAIKAQGGADKIAKRKASTVQFKGKFYGMGEGIDYTAEVAEQQPSQRRMQINFEIQGMKFAFIQVLNGDKGWLSFMNQTNEMDKEQVAEMKEELYFGRVNTLVPLKDKEFKLSPLGDSKVGKRAVVGIQVMHKDHRDINLFFDKETGRLVKTEHKIKDIQAGGQEFTHETLLDDYKEVDGIQVPMKLVINRDGKLYVDAEMTEVKLHEKLDDSTFGKP